MKSSIKEILRSSPPGRARRSRKWLVVPGLLAVVLSTPCCAPPSKRVVAFGLDVDGRASPVLALEAGQERRFLFEAEPVGQLEIAAVEGGSDCGRLHVLVEAEDGGTRQVAVECRTRGFRFPITASEGERTQAFRLTLRAETDLQLDDPRITAPVSAARPLGARSESVPADVQKAPNIVVYLVDTLRADHLSTYGYERETSPNLDAFARRATVFEDAVAQSPWTRPSVVSLLTGLSPVEHGVNGRKDLMGEDLLSVAEILSGSGYETVGFVANPNVRRRFGLPQGFDVYRFVKAGYDGPFSVNQRVRSWLRERQSPSKPFFLYVHTVAPHAPYNPPVRWRDALDANDIDSRLTTRAFMKALARNEEGNEETSTQLKRLYDAEIAWNDEAFGEFTEILRDSGVLEDSLFVFLSDHGEEFAEHGRWEHGKSLFTEVLRIPLVVRFPGQTVAARTHTLAQHIDFVPTVLDILGLRVPAQLTGRPWCERASANPDPAAVSILDVDGLVGESLTTPDWKLVSRQGRDRLLYARSRDPREQDPVVNDIRTELLAETLRKRMERMHHRKPSDEVVLDSELEEELDALGYIE